MLVTQQYPVQQRYSTPTQQLRKKIQNYSFNLHQKIGKGYTSTVYKGRNETTQQVVAIKVIDLKSINDQIKRNLLQIQLECIKKINHSNLLRYLDSYQTVNNCYIVTEFCEGGDLEKLLRVKGRFTEAEFKGIFRQVYAGYQSFLQAGFIHRDLKPANIFIKGDQIKIADFGMVKKLSQNPRDSYNVGTPVYMPPQSLISNIYSQKSDVWSLGVMCYQLIHGTFPWRGQDQRELKLNIQNVKVVYDYNLISVELATFINQCLDKNPNTRISIAEMMNNPWVKGVIGDNYRVNYGISINNSYNPNIINNNSNTFNANNYKNAQMLTKNNQNQNQNQNHNQNQNQNNVLGQRNLNIVSPLRSFTAPKSLSLNHIPSITMLPLQAVPSLQLIENNENSNTMNRMLKSERPTMDSETPAPQPSKRKTSLLESNRPIQNHTPSSAWPQKIPYKSSSTSLPKKSPLDYLISILNYLRYLHKIYKVIKDTKSSLLPQALSSKLISLILKQLIKCLISQEKVMKNKENVYGLAGWEDFVGSKKWGTYANVVGQYSQKYRKIHEDHNQSTQPQPKQNYRRISIPLKQSIQSLHKIIKQNLPELYLADPKKQTNHNHNHNHNHNEIYEIMELIDYLIAVYNMEQAIFCYGWLIFVEKSTINQIVECKCVVNQGNWEDIWGKLEAKICAIASYG